MEETIDLTLDDDSPPPPPARVRKRAAPAPAPASPPAAASAAAAARRASSMVTIDIEDSPPPLSLDDDDDDDDSPPYRPTTTAAAGAARGRPPAPIAIDLEGDPDDESFDGSLFGATWMPEEVPPRLPPVAAPAAPPAAAPAPTAAAVRRRLLAAAATGPARATATAPAAAAPIIRQRMGRAALLRVTIATEEAGMPPKELRADWDALVAVSGWFERCLSEEWREGRTGAVDLIVDSWDEYRALERLVALAEAAARAGPDGSPNVDYTRDPATREALSVKELAILLRCGHQWAFAGCVGACAERILDVLEEGEDPRDAADAIGELPHTLYEEEATLEILMQCGILVFQSADANGAFFEQHLCQTRPPSSSSSSSSASASKKRRRSSGEGSSVGAAGGRRRIMPKWDLLKVVSPNIYALPFPAFKAGLLFETSLALEERGEPVLGFTAQEAFEDCLPLLEGEFDRMRPEFLRHVVRRSRHLRAAPLGNGGVRAAMAALEGLRSGRMVADGDGGDGPPPAAAPPAAPKLDCTYSRERVFASPAPRCRALDDGAQLHVLFLQGGLPFTLSLEKRPPPARRPPADRAGGSSGGDRVVVFKAKATPQLHLALAEPPDLLAPRAPEETGEDDGEFGFGHDAAGVFDNEEAAAAAPVHARVELRLRPYSQQWEAFPAKARGTGNGTGSPFGFALGGGSLRSSGSSDGGGGGGSHTSSSSSSARSVALDLTWGAPWDQVFAAKAHKGTNPFLTLLPAPSPAVVRLAMYLILRSDWLAAEARERARRRLVKAEGIKTEEGGGKGEQDTKGKKKAATTAPAAAAAAAGRAGGHKERESLWDNEPEPDPMAFAPGVHKPDEFYERDFMRRVHGGLWGRDLLD